jgi:hypothetical protein
LFSTEGACFPDSPQLSPNPSDPSSATVSERLRGEWLSKDAHHEKGAGAHGEHSLQAPSIFVIGYILGANLLANDELARTITLVEIVPGQFHCVWLWFIHQSDSLGST